MYLLIYVSEIHVMTLSILLREVTVAAFNEISRHFPKALRKTTEVLVIIGVLTEIQTRHLLNTSQLVTPTGKLLHSIISCTSGVKKNSGCQIAFTTTY
jgi:hypothetical protein